jgi:uncharacterized protein (UPF0276 family)
MIHPVPPARGASLLERHNPRKALGVGLSYIPVLPADLYRPGLLDFVEITPEKLCRAQRDGAVLSMDLVPEKLDRARMVCGELPIVVHGVELSIGSARGWNDGYLDMLGRFQWLWPFLWHSEHLSYQTISEDGGRSIDIGTPLPLPGTAEAVELVGARAAAIGRRYGVPFLLENPAHYLAELPYEAEIGDEIGLMAAIIERGNCGQLLDLHNLYCNALNLGFDALYAVDRIRLDRVIEIHVAGGRFEDGFWMDAHDNLVPEPVWELLEYTLPRCPNVAGVVFELLDFYALKVGADAIAEELRRMQESWRRRSHTFCPMQQ